MNVCAKINAKDRDDIAKMANRLTQGMSEAEAIETISGAFIVSEREARNLITRGRSLAREAMVKEAGRSIDA